MTKKGQGPQDEKPRGIADDQEAGYHAGENLAPRNRGEVADAQDRGAAERSAGLAREARAGGDENPTPLEPTSWEARVERGEEWTVEQTPERERRGDEEADSEVSRRGLVNPPPEE